MAAALTVLVQPSITALAALREWCYTTSPAAFDVPLAIQLTNGMCVGVNG